MKKTLIFAVALIAMAFTSQAVSFRWSTNQIGLPGTTGNVGSGKPVDLLNLGKSGTFSYASYFLGDYSVVTTKNTATGAFIGKVNLQNADFGMLGSSASSLNNVVLTALIKFEYNSVIYYNVSSTFTITGVVDDSWQPATDPVSFDFGSFAKNDILKTWGSIADGAEFATEAEAWAAAYAAGGSGWNSFSVKQILPVPEPATGAMALAGLALLFRRKRK